MANKLFCPKCGQELPLDSGFCPYCGAKLEDPKAPSDPARAKGHVSPKMPPPHPAPVASDLVKGLSAASAGIALLPLLPQLSVAGLELNGIGLIRVMGTGLSVATEESAGVGDLSLFLIAYISLWLVTALAAAISCYDALSKGKVSGLRATFVVEAALFGLTLLCALWLEGQAGTIGLSVVAPTIWAFVGLGASVIGALMVPARDGAILRGAGTREGRAPTDFTRSATPEGRRAGCDTGSGTQGGDGVLRASDAAPADTVAHVPAKGDVGEASDAVPAASQRICDAATTTLVSELRCRGALTEEEAREVTRRLTGA